MIENEQTLSITVGASANQHVIKVPVYVSETKTDSVGFFGGITYKNMIESLTRKIDEYNISSGEIKSVKKKKIFEKVVKGIEYSETLIDNRSGLLVKMTAYNTNYIDGFFEENNKIALTKKSKIGSENNFMLMYPSITGLNPVSYKYRWMILLYEDPNKDFNEQK